MADDYWYCTYCGDPHPPDLGTQVDARYALGDCGLTKRPLVRERSLAERLANTVGKYRPDKHRPVGSGYHQAQVEP